MSNNFDHEHYAKYGDPHGEQTAPPRIEDMAPGTTFTAEVPDRWLVQVESGGALFADTCVERKSLEHIDPSTIRDVTPPMEATDAPN